MLWCVVPLLLIFSLAAPWSTTTSPSDLAQGEQFLLDVSPTWYAGVTIQSVQTATRDGPLRAASFARPPPLQRTPHVHNETTSLSVHPGDFEFVAYFLLDGKLECNWTVSESLYMYLFDSEASYHKWRDEGDNDFISYHYGTSHSISLELENAMGVVAFENEQRDVTSKGSITCTVRDRQYDLSHPTASCSSQHGSSCLLALPYASDTVVIVSYPEDTSNPTATATLRYSKHGRLLAYWLVFGSIVLCVALCAAAGANRRRKQWEAFADAQPAAGQSQTPNYGATSGYPAAPPQQAVPSGSLNPYDAYRSNPTPPQQPPYEYDGASPQQWQKAPPPVNPNFAPTPNY